MKAKEKTTAARYAFVFGAFGGHFYYLGDAKRGTARLLCSCFVPLLFFVNFVKGISEGRRLLKMSEEEFRLSCAATESNDAKEEAKELPIKEEPPRDLAEKYQILEEFKDLLDDGTITEEEFFAVKRTISEGKYV